LAQLSFFRTAGWAIHIGGLYGNPVVKFLRPPAYFRAGTPILVRFRPSPRGKCQ
jgi:hypothetical protein